MMTMMMMVVMLMMMMMMVMMMMKMMMMMTAVQTTIQHISHRGEGRQQVRVHEGHHAQRRRRCAVLAGDRFIFTHNTNNNSN